MPEETNSPLAVSKLFPVPFHLGVELSEISSIHIDMSTGVAIVDVLFKQPYYWEFIDIASLSQLEDMNY